MSGSISVLGLGSGLELQNILEQLRKADEAPIERLKTEQTKLKEQISAFDELTSGLLNAKGHALNLTLDSTYLGRSVSVTDETVLTASVGTGATVASRQIEVSQLAQTSSWEGAGVTGEDAVVNSSGADQTFTYRVGSGDAVSLTVANGTTLQGLADLINNDATNPGVTASVINDGSGATPYRLVLTANNTGESGRIAIDGQLSGYTFTEKTGASGASLNAQLTIDGITYQREKNTGINDIFSGVTLNLNKAGNVSLSVSSDNTGLKDAIKGMVEEINKVITSSREKSGYDKDGNPNTLQSVSSAKRLAYELVDILSEQVKTGGSITSMSDLGLKVNRDGSISLDENTLDKALSQNYEDVKKFLLGTTDGTQEITGFAESVNDSLRSYTVPGTGVFPGEKTAAETRIKDIDTNIASANERLNKKYAVLEKQFAELDSFLSKMNQMSTYLKSQFNSLSGKTEK